MEKENLSFNSISRIFSVCIAVLLVSGLSGCATSGFLGFGDPLTTITYVDNAVAELEQKTEGVSADLALMRTEIEALTTLKNEIDDIIAVMEKNQEDTAELQGLADRVGERLDGMPVEMLRQLVEALQIYLESAESN